METLERANETEKRFVRNGIREGIESHGKKREQQADSCGRGETRMENLFGATTHCIFTSTLLRERERKRERRREGGGGTREERKGEVKRSEEDGAHLPPPILLLLVHNQRQGETTSKKTWPRGWKEDWNIYSRRTKQKGQGERNMEKVSMYVQCEIKGRRGGCN